MKSLTRDEVARRQSQAVQFTRDVVGDLDLADEIENLSVEEYADRKRFQLSNPNGEGVSNMAKTEQVLERLDALTDKVESLSETIKRNEKPTHNNPAATRTIVLPPRNRADRLTKRMRAERDKILDAMEDAQAALDEGQYDEAADILDEVLDEYETEEEDGNGEED